MITVQDLIGELREWVDTPVLQAGAIKGVGCNCLGMMAGAARNLGLEDLWRPFEPYQGLAHPPERLFMVRKLKRYLIQTKAPEPGCLLFLREKDNSHVALISREGFDIIEAVWPRVTEHRLDRPFLWAFRVPGVRYG